MFSTRELQGRRTAPALPTIAFDRSEVAWDGYHAFLTGLIERHAARDLCDLGGGANPVLDPGWITARGLGYTLLDISAEELAKTPACYHKVQADVCAAAPPLSARFDLVFSRMLLEHVVDAERFHRNVLAMLKPGGLAFHFFPTLFAAPFVVNRLLFGGWTDWLLRALAPRDPLRAGKFPAYYQGCRGPSSRQIARLERLGYQVVEYRGFFGHRYYDRLPGVGRLERLARAMLLRHPWSLMTSYAYLVLQKPATPNHVESSSAAGAAAA
jgi:SAM-dependent methyltransferase